MAIGRLSMKVGKAGKAGPHAAYIAREGQYADRLKRGEKLEATEAGNMPAWAQSTRKRSGRRRTPSSARTAPPTAKWRLPFRVSWTPISGPRWCASLYARR